MELRIFQSLKLQGSIFFHQLQYLNDLSFQQALH
nr:MAG TPA: hypothetical protein [Caudoviricetes sp.]